MSVFDENDYRRLSNFYKLIVFENLIMFLEPASKLITEIFDLKK